MLCVLFFGGCVGVCREHTTLCTMNCRDGRRFIWAIDGWSERRKLPVIRSDSFNLTGSERTWVLSRTSETDSLHLTCSGLRHTLRTPHPNLTPIHPGLES